jgi:2-oxoglutarate ferredoxin oxidoreductase subunit beta
MNSIDGVLLALSLGATFVARSFSGDKAQLVPLLKAGLMHQGFAFIDIISPCVTFNDHEGSTKGYAYTREHQIEVVHTDYVDSRAPITAEYEPGSSRTVMLHDGSSVRLRKVGEEYDPTDRDRAYAHVREHQNAGEVPTGLLYIDENSADMIAQNRPADGPLHSQPYEKLCPGSAELEKLQLRFR